MNLDSPNDSKKNWPVKQGLNGLSDPHWDRVNKAKGLWDNGKEAPEPKKKGKK
jgi:hypothetical protein